MDHLNPDNCNKAKCKSCIFHTNGNALPLSRERMEEITGYLERFESSHQCHTTNKTCYGALEVQAKAMHKANLIPAPTVSVMLIMAKAYLSK